MTSTLVEDEAALKEWICERIPSTFEGEPEAFAKYVVALLRKAPASTTVRELESLRKRCVEQLDAFLQGETKHFVDRLFDAITLRSYLAVDDVKEEEEAHTLQPNEPNLTNGQAGTPDGSTRNSPAKVRPRILAPESPDDAVTNSDQQRLNPLSRPLPASPRRTAKRVRDHDEEAGKGSSDDSDDDERVREGGVRKIRRVEFTTREARRQRHGQRPGLSERFSHIDTATRANGAGGAARKTRARGTCRSYELLGYCLRGESCPRSHGPHPVVVVGVGGQQTAYNPETPSINLVRPPPGSVTHEAGVGVRRMLKRAPLPKTNSLLVKRLPVEHNTISQLNDYFGQFGELKNIQTTFEAQHDTALVTYESVDSATRAYRSQQPIFNNRFVHLQWYRAESDGTLLTGLPGAMAAGVSALRLPMAALPPPQLVIPVLSSASRSSLPDSVGTVVSAVPRHPGRLHPRIPQPATVAPPPPSESANAKAALMKLKTRLYLMNTEKLKLLLTQMKSLGDATSAGSQSPSAGDSAETARKRGELAKQIAELSAELKSQRKEIVGETDPTSRELQTSKKASKKATKVAPPQQAGFGSAI